MPTLNAGQMTTLTVTQPNGWVTVTCVAGDEMAVSWTGPGSVSGMRTVKNIAEDVGPFVDGTVVTLRAVNGAPQYTNPLSGGITADAANTLQAAASFAQTTYIDALCDDGSGIAKDRSGSGNHIVPGSGAVSPWANAGYITTTAAASGSAGVPSARFRLDLATDSFIWAMTIKMAAPGANQSIAGFANTVSNYGVYWSARTGSNVALPIFNGSGGAWSALVSGYTFPVTCDGTDHHIAVAYDAPSRSVYFWIDGKLQITAPNVVSPGATSPTSTDFTLGANLGPGATAVACQFKNVRFLKFASAGLPLNVGQIVDKSYRRPELQLLASDILPAPTKRLCLGWVGQSNESGSSDYPDRFGDGIGAPNLDAITATGLTSVTAATTSSWHPRLSRLLGARGVWLDTLNSARGTTSLAQMWVGQIVTWSAGATYGVGAYTVGSGRLYKLTSSSGSTSGSTNTAVVGGTVPTWPASGTVVDGDATWTFQRASTADDVVGVLTQSSALFDPNGWLAALATAMNARAVGDRVIAISIGQTDKTVGTTSAQFRDAYIAVANWALSRGYKVAMGFTCDGTTAGLSTWLSGTGQPGKNSALAAFGGNGNVFAGADLYAALGTLAVSTTTVGLKADQLHLNVYAKDSAAEAWDRALQAAGY